VNLNRILLDIPFKKKFGYKCAEGKRCEDREMPSTR
jgi:hypothetical protein